MTDGTPKPQLMGKQQIAAFLLGNGWARDRQGHLRKQGAKRLFRIKFQEESVRMEVQSNGWIRVGGGFYRNVKLHDDGRMQIGTDFFGK